MQIWIKTLTARKTPLDVDETTTIMQVKQELHEKEGIGVEQIRLIFQGRQTADTAQLGSLGVKAGDQLHMVLALRG
jgi:ubiquitin-like protein Nedd8